MANLIVESFDWFPSGQSAATRNRLWGANSFFERVDTTGGVMSDADVTAGRFGYGNAIALSGGFHGFSVQTQGYVIPTGATPATGFLGCGVYVNSAIDTHNRPLLAFFDGVANYMQISISFEKNGVITVWRGGRIEDNILLASSATGSFQENEWFHCEIKALIAGSGGTVEVRVNTVPVIQVVGANTQKTANAYFDSVLVGGSGDNNNIALSSTTPIIFDDLFVNDTTGGQNNTWVGNLRAYGMFMTANGYLDNFSIGGSLPAATHWQSVLNQSLDDTKYEYSPTVGDIDAFVPNPVVNGPLVRVLQMRAALRQDDATQRVARLGVRIGGTNYFGSKDQYTNQTYTFYKDKFELSPATGVTPTGPEVNGCQALVKVQA